MNKEIATISRTSEILQLYQLTPKKGYGQNFIIEPEIVRQIATKAEIDQDTLVLEIGPGIGALTEQLAKRAGFVLAYEIDTKLIDVLSDTLREYPNIQIIEADVLNQDLLTDTVALRAQFPKLAVCANLPYYVTTPILFHLIESNLPLSSLTFMVQKEIADRFTAKPNTKEYNGLSVLLQYRYTIKTVMKVPPTIFIPKPAVDSVVVRFVPKETDATIDFPSFSDLIKGCFTQRRKTIYNNLRDYFHSKEKAEEILTKAEISYQRRAESLNLEEFIRLYEVTK